MLLDLRMPDMGGLEVLQKLRQNESTIPVVMLTTSNEETDLIKSLRSGAQGSLLKDMEPDELVSAFRDIEILQMPSLEWSRVTPMSLMKKARFQS